MVLVIELLATAPAAGTISLLTTALLLGIRHGIDWDHIAAITDITSSTAAADAGERAHAADHARRTPAHGHGGLGEFATHLSATEPRPSPDRSATTARPGLRDIRRAHGRAFGLGTLYALGHASVVAVLGFLALSFGALLPDWVDPVMSRVVGVTLIVLGLWVFYAVYAYVRNGTEFRLRSRWMLLLGWLRHGWRWLRARLHGHDHVAAVESSSYGPRTAFGVGMIHGIGAETGTQVLIIAAVGGAASAGLGIPMMIAFVLGLLISNSVIVVLTATGFVASQVGRRLYLIVGSVAGALSLIVGIVFLVGAEGALPELGSAARILRG